MQAIPMSPVTITAEAHYPRRYLFTVSGFLGVWLAATLCVGIIMFAQSVTRFHPGDPLPTARLATVLASELATEPEQTGVLLTVSVRKIEEFRARHPHARLRPVTPGSGTLKQGHLTIHYDVRAGAIPGEFEVTTHASMPDMDSPGSFGYVQLRYRVRGDQLEPLAMVADDPFTRWFVVGFLLFVMALLPMTLLTRRFERPLHAGQLMFLPPFNRDWLVTTGVPLRFAPAPKELTAVAQALTTAGAKVKVCTGHDRLSARCGGRALLSLRRAVTDNALEVRIEAGALQQTGSVLLVLGAPVAALFAIKTLLFGLLDPFAALLPASGEALGWLLAGVAMLWIGRHLTAVPRATQEADQLGNALIASLADLGSRPVSPLGWPGEIPARLQPRWRRWLSRLLIAVVTFPLWGSLLVIIAGALGLFK